MPSYAPTAAEAFLLALIRHRESENRYDQLPTEPLSSASGAYDYIIKTWQAMTKMTGVGTAYPQAYLAPPVDQDYNALIMLRQYGPNSSYSWKASGPYPTLAECETAMRFA